MKKTTLLSAALVAGLCQIPLGSMAQQTDAQKQEVVKMTTNREVGSELTFTMNTGTVSVDWGDGNPVEIESTGDPITGNLKGQTVTVSAAKISYLDCSFSDLTGLEVRDASSLRTLYCGNNSLSDLSIQSNGYLESLDCSNNELKSISLSSQRNLKVLDCSGNNFTTLGVGTATKLTILICSDNNLSTLTLTSVPELTTLWCQNNQLKTLDFSKNSNIQSVVCDGNKLTKITVSGSNVVDFWCNNNQLENLDLSRSITLETLSCSNNQLSNLSLAGLSGRKALAVYLENNKLGFSDFYSTNNMLDYVLGPQQNFSLGTKEINVNGYVDVPDYEKNVDGQEVNANINWLNTQTGEELVYGRTEDYTSRSNRYTFLKPFESIQCVVTSTLYPGIELLSEELKVSEPTGVKDVNAEAGLVCKGENGQLYMTADKTIYVRVFTADGKQVWSGTVTNTGVSLNLGHGIFVVNGVKVSL